MNANRLVEFPQPIFKRATLAIVSQQLFAGPQSTRPVGDQKEVLRQQIQLTGGRIRFVDDHQNQSLSMLPTIGLILAELNDILITTGWRTPRRTFQVRLGKAF